MKLGTPYTSTAKKVLLLGSGELGKELTIELSRLGVEVTACDRYAGAPAMQVAHESRVFDMLDAQQLRSVVETVKPQLIVPEVEAICTEELIRLENEGWAVAPTARATQITMDREGIRRLAAEELEIPTAKYALVDTLEEFKKACLKLGYPCVAKPIMSSSGKGQSLLRSQDDVTKAWDYAQSGGRAGAGRVIVEEFIDFESEITLLTVRAINGVQFCAPIGHKQVGGDYIHSWQPHKMPPEQLLMAQRISEKITTALGGFGIFGVELFLLKNGGVLFSEVSPRPHDTGMVTMTTQMWSEFALHARAVLGLPIPEIPLRTAGASVALKAHCHSSAPEFLGVDRAMQTPQVDVRLFGKPASHPGRRMGVVLAAAESAESALQIALESAKQIEIIG
ncbi:MAG: formate-dependent phosphoribosylglycinamide formyltransferase [Pseudomonadota bacterium]